MRLLSIPVHPLSRRVLLCEYGAEPLIIPNHDFAFRLLTSSPIQNRARRNAQKLTARISLYVDEQIARHVESHLQNVGLNILSFHFQTLCRFADAALQLQGSGNVKAAIEHWLSIHQVDENEYAADTAYKLWQRHSWNLQEKNAHFFGRSRVKSAGKMSKKLRVHANRPSALNPAKMTIPQIEAELAAARFTAAISACFRRPPKKIVCQARIYYYMVECGMSCRDVAALLGIPKSTAAHARRSIEQRAAQNRTVAKLLEEALNSDLPTAR